MLPHLYDPSTADDLFGCSAAGTGLAAENVEILANRACFNFQFCVVVLLGLTQLLIFAFRCLMEMQPPPTKVTPSQGLLRAY